MLVAPSDCNACFDLADDGGICRRHLFAAAGTIQAAIRHGTLVDQDQLRWRMHSGFALVDDHDREYLHHRTTETGPVARAGTIVPVFFESWHTRAGLVQAVDQRNVPAHERHFLDRGRSHVTVNEFAPSETLRTD